MKRTKDEECYWALQQEFSNSSELMTDAQFDIKFPLWLLSEYNCTVDDDRLCFENDEDYTMFLIKYSAVEALLEIE